MSRQMLLLAHLQRPGTLGAARVAATRLLAAGVIVRVLEEEAEALGVPGTTMVRPEVAAEGCEVAFVLGGDGSLLRGAEVVRPWGTPLLGVNLGRVGFLAEAEAEALEPTVEKVLAGDYTVDERMTLDVSVHCNGRETGRGWALNEVVVEKTNRTHLLDCLLEIDGRPLSRWGCDGVVLATPTGSTAYAFSAGGPIVWPGVAALLVVPISAHALFARPLIAGPDSHLVVEVLPGQPAALSCDGRRTMTVEAPGRVEVVRGHEPVRLVRLQHLPFTDRLVAKFSLPVSGWRDRGD
jgi:NAD+ kinase